MSLLESMAQPFLSDGLFVELVVQFCIFLLLGISLDLVMGYTGLFQLGHVGFFALGALGTTFATHPDWLGLDMFAGIVLGMLFATAAAVVVGLPTLRLPGDYFAIATFGFGLSVQAVLIGYWATGIFGVPGPNPLGCDPACMADTPVGHAVGTGVARALFLDGLATPAETGLELAILLLFTIGAYVLVGRLKHAPLGRALKSIREDPRAAMSLGKNVTALRFKALWVSVLVQSLAGSLWAHHVRNLGPHFYGFEFLMLTVIAVILGGLGTHAGALVGAALFVLVNEESKALGAWAGEQWPVLATDFSVPALRLVLFGALLVAVMVLRPSGLLGERDVTWRTVRDWLRRRRTKQAEGDA